MKSKILKNKCNLFKSKASVHRRLLSLLFLCTFLLEPKDALANCEASIHGIHTIAEYGSSNELGTFYMFVTVITKSHMNIHKERGDDTYFDVYKTKRRGMDIQVSLQPMNKKAGGLS